MRKLSQKTEWAITLIMYILIAIAGKLYVDYDIREHHEKDKQRTSDQVSSSRKDF